MFRLSRFLLVGLVLPACWWGTALAGDASGVDQPTVPLVRLVPDLRLSVSDMPGETTLRLPLSSENGLLYGLLSPYLSLAASTALSTPWNWRFRRACGTTLRGPSVISDSGRDSLYRCQIARNSTESTV